MAQSTTDIGSAAPRTTGEFLVASTKRGFASLGTIIKWMIYGWAARLALAAWFVMGFLPAAIVTEHVSIIPGIATGLVGITIPAVAYGAYRVREESDR